jgi:putative ABC transport system substrate-binding protein
MLTFLRSLQEGKRMGRVQRRDFLIAAAALLAATVAAETPQGPKLPRIGYLMFNSAATGRDVFIAFRQAMRELGWIDGQNLVIETRFAEGEVDRLPGLAKELLLLKVDLIVAGSSAATRASKFATTTVPIVMLQVRTPSARDSLPA